MSQAPILLAYRLNIRENAISELRTKFSVRLQHTLRRTSVGLHRSKKGRKSFFTGVDVALCQTAAATRVTVGHTSLGCRLCTSVIRYKCKRLKLGRLLVNYRDYALESLRLCLERLAPVAPSETSLPCFNCVCFNMRFCKLKPADNLPPLD